MTKLNQVIAIEKGVKSRVYGEITELNKVIQHPDLFNGFSKNYQKRDDDSEDLPAERKRVQFNVTNVLQNVQNAMSQLFDVVAQKDITNCSARADIKVEGKTILSSVPATYLLFLEKQLTDLRTFVDNIPVLDETEDWSKDPNSGLYKAAPTQTHRTKKVQRPIVLYNATPEHPAQTQLITEDVIAGLWTQVKQSGAMPKPQRQALAERIEKLLRAVKEAREAANDQEVPPIDSVGPAIFNYLLTDTSA